MLHRHLTLLLLATALPAVAESVTSEPIGFNKVTCLSNSDTIVGVPFRVQGSLTTKAAAVPVVNAGSATLTLTVTNLTAGALTRHFIKFNSGAKDGAWYDVTDNTTDSVTIDLNGDNLTGVVAGDALVIAEYWTLNALFPPAAATTDPGTTGHAIVASIGTLAFQRRTELLLPDLQGAGINRATSGKYYIHGGIWKKSGDATGADQGALLIYPDSYFTVRHPASVAASTVFKSTGEVEVRNFTIPLATLTTGQQDTFVGIPRPVGVTLAGLNLWQSGAFVKSDGILAFQRRDLLLVFDNAAAAQNRSASATYFHNGTSWLKLNDGTVNHDTDIIPAGAGFIIRKYRTADGSSALWKNTPSY